LIQKLLDGGADITLVPAIFEAIDSEDPEATAAVFDAGADANTVYHPKHPRQCGRGPKVKTPLLSAAMKVDGIYLREKGEQNCQSGNRSLPPSTWSEPSYGTPGRETYRPP
jgi:hypothetical protein